MKPALTIFFIGDSLTEFFDWQQRFPEHEVLNLGLSGETVQGLSARIRRIIGSAAVPDVIFIMTGIINLIKGDNDILDEYETILKRLKTADPSTTIIVQSILPVATQVDLETIEKINRNLRGIVDELKINFLNLYNLFVDQTGRPKREYLLDDGVHLSEKGYEAWSAAVAEFLDYLPRNSSSSRSSSSRE